MTTTVKLFPSSSLVFPCFHVCLSLVSLSSLFQVSYPSSSSSHAYRHAHQPSMMHPAAASQHHPPLSSQHLPGGLPGGVGGHLSSSSSSSGSPSLPPVSYPSPGIAPSAPFASYPRPNVLGGPALQQSGFIPSGNMTISGNLDDPRSCSSFGGEGGSGGEKKSFFSRLLRLSSLLSSSSAKEGGGYDQTSSHAPGMIGGMSGSQSYSVGRGADDRVAKDDEDDDFKDEPPLLEGISSSCSPKQLFWANLFSWFLSYSSLCIGWATRGRQTGRPLS